MIPNGLELLIARYIEDHAGLEHAIDGGSDGDGPHRHAMQEIGRAVEWVHDPDKAVSHQPGFSSSPTRRPPGVASFQDRRNELLRGAVHLGDEVALVLHAPPSGPAGRVTPRR